MHEQELSLTIPLREAEGLVRLIEAAPGVRRRYQFFVWTQSQLQTLLPHRILVCGAYHRQRRELAFEAFNNVVVAPEVLDELTDTRGLLLRLLVGDWIEGRGRPQVLPLGRLAAALDRDSIARFEAVGIASLLVHGHARPQRPSELESLFIVAGDAPVGAGKGAPAGTERARFAGPGDAPGADAAPSRTGEAGLGAQALQAAQLADLLMPHLHTAWLRVSAAERETAPPQPPAPPPRGPAPGEPASVVTERENEILGWMREGKSNQQIAEVLGISPLTVKNHVQKILRKLGASNRAQAVAQAMSRGLLDGRAGPASG